MASSPCSLPMALSILKSELEYPAMVNALVRYGRSYWTYRVDDTVSGRMTPTSPLPAAVSGLSDAIGEKLLSSELTLSPDGTVTAPPPDDDGVLLDPHAAATATTPSTAPNCAALVKLPETMVVLLRCYTAKGRETSDPLSRETERKSAPSAAYSSLSCSARASAPRTLARSC